MSRDAKETLGHPEDLPMGALPYWPDLNRWPTAADVSLFKRSTRRNPEARLGVLNGLRSWSAIDLTSVWSWTGAFITLAIAGIGATIAVEGQWVQLLLGTSTAVGAFIFLMKLASLSTTADRRRRRAHIWLRALE